MLTRTAAKSTDKTRAKLPWGAQSAIARRLRVNPSLVSRVHRGLATSAKVSRAIQEALYHVRRNPTSL